MIVQTADKLRKLGTEIFRVQGLQRDRAAYISDTMVEASLTGHDSHGVSYFVTYSDRIKEGFIDVKAEPSIVRETPSSALVDGRWAPGQVTALKVMEIAVEKAKKHTISAVGAYNCNHIGRVGYYTNWAAQKDVVAMMFLNVGRPSTSVYCGVGKVFGTNPFSASVPTDNVKPFIIDYATSVVAAGKVTMARIKNQKIPSHWIRDKDGKPTDDPSALKEGGWLLPFGEHKGYCLLLLTEILGAVMTGSRTGLNPNLEPPSTNGIFAVAIDPDSFVGLDIFKRETANLLEEVKDIRSEPGKRVLVPGDPEWETKEKRLKEGIPIPEETWEKITSLAKELGIKTH